MIRHICSLLPAHTPSRSERRHFYCKTPSGTGTPEGVFSIPLSVRIQAVCSLPLFSLRSTAISTTRVKTST